MRVNLAVPFSEKDDAKRKGARWDAARKTWYIENVDDVGAFRKWIPALAGWHPALANPKKKRRKHLAPEKSRITMPQHSDPLYCGAAPPWD